MGQRTRLRGDIVATAVITAILMAVVPAVASTIVNADKLDGRFGVGCAAPRTHVAT